MNPASGALRALLTILSFFFGVVLRAQIITTFAGTPTVGGFNGAGPATSLLIGQPFNVAADNSGNVFFTDPPNNRIYKVNTAGMASICAGFGLIGHTGDGGPAIAAEIDIPYWLSVDNAGNLYFSENSGAVRKIDASGIITTMITAVQANATASTGDGGPLSAATFMQITGIVPDNAGNFYISDYTAGVVRKVNSAGIMSTIAGTGTLGFSGDGGPAIAAQLNHPYPVAFDNAGNIYIPDAGNWRVRKIDASGIISTVAGNGAVGYSGDGGPATNAEFFGPWQVRFDAGGNMYIDDDDNYCVRKVDITGTISTYAGIGGPSGYGYSGDGGPANMAKMTEVMGIALDNGGNLYIVDHENYCIRKVTNCVLAQISAEPANVTICSGGNTSLTLVATGSTGYQWQVNTGAGWNDVSNGGVYGGATTNSLTITSAVLGMDAAQYRCSIVNGCGTIATTPVVLTVNSTSAPTVTIATAANSVCAGSPVSFTATATNSGSSPAYQWLLNGVPTGVPGVNFSDGSLNNGDVVSCVLTTNSTCAPTSTATSNPVTMAVSPVVTPGISVAGPIGVVCAGTPVSFTASAMNGGAAPAYQWEVNGMGVGSNGSTFASSGLNNGDVVSCVLTSNAGCVTAATAVSNLVTMTVAPMVTPAVSVSGPIGTVCAGTPVSFTASGTNGGAAPAYQWEVNGVPAGATGVNFIDGSLNNGDAISCVMTSDATCLTAPDAISNTIVEQVQATVIPVVSVAASATAICSGTQVTFTATPVNGGSAPAYQWLLNGTGVGTNGSTYTNSGLNNGDVVSCVLTSSESCSVPATSQNPVVMTVNATPTVTVMPDTIIGLGQSVVLNSDVTGPVTSYQWTPASGLNNPNSAAPVASPENTTTYQVIVGTGEGCTANGKVTIGVFKTLVMPGAFTPNGDGKNDLFRIPPSLAVKIKVFAVYDRWGTRVFYTTNSSAGWDGTLGGQPQPVGTYVWMIEYEDLLTGRMTMAKGTVILVR